MCAKARGPGRGIDPKHDITAAKDSILVIIFALITTLGAGFADSDFVGHAGGTPWRYVGKAAKSSKVRQGSGIQRTSFAASTTRGQAGEEGEHGNDAHPRRLSVPV